ncbi:MAG TPA: hypothetical protein VHK69_01595, partial [Chitinophagaceae bacterium]|nr:hypothetical protein [Chitinophagaceae bacterium]
FGQRYDSSGQGNGGRLPEPFHFTAFRSLDPGADGERKAWLRQKLAEQNLDPRLFKVVLHVKTFSAKTSAVLRKEMYDEKVIYLD